MAPVTLVSGPESFLAERAVSGVVQAARRADSQADTTEVSGAELNPGLILEHTSPSLFATHRVLVVRGVADVDEAAGEALVNATEAGITDAHLVLVHPGGQKNKRLLERLGRAGAQQITCERLTRAEDQVEFVRREVAMLGGSIDQPAARRLVEAAGADLRTLAAASAQLVSDAHEGEITAEVVGTYFEGHAEVKGWAVADLAVQGQVDEALEQLRWALQTGTAAVLVTGSLASSLRTLAQLSGMPRGGRDADLARELGVPPWKLRTLRSQLRGWDPDGLGRALQAVARADLQVKGGSNDAVHTLAAAVLDVAAARSA